MLGWPAVALVLACCAHAASAGCFDSSAECAEWAANGECSRNPLYMHEACQRSCHACGGGGNLGGNLGGSRPARADSGEVTLASGLFMDTYYIPPHCAERSRVGMDAWMDYTGWVCLSPGRDCLHHFGNKFDSSRDPGRTPFKFPLGAGHVIEGWDIGLVGMCVGEKRKLVIPAAMGYGAKGTSGIPGGATLLFDVTLRNMRAPTKPPSCPLSDAAFAACRKRGGFCPAGRSCYVCHHGHCHPVA